RAVGPLHDRDPDPGSGGRDADRHPRQRARRVGRLVGGVAEYELPDVAQQLLRLPSAGAVAEEGVVPPPAGLLSQQSPARHRHRPLRIFCSSWINGSMTLMGRSSPRIRTLPSTRIVLAWSLRSKWPSLFA